MYELPIVDLTPLPTAAAWRRNVDRPQRGVNKGEGKSTASIQKKALIVGCALLFFASLTALILVVMSRNSEQQYNQSMKQFAGRIMVKKMNDEFLEWADEYEDANSVPAKSLISDISKNVLSGLAMEGVLTDDIRVVGIAPSEPRSFRVVTQSDKNGASDTMEYEDVRFVTITFETYGIPSRNVPVFMASNGRWGKVASVIEARMAATGLQVDFEQIDLQEDFISNVKEAARSDLSLLQVSPPPSPIIDVCDCEIDGRRINGESMTCQCDSPCFPSGDKKVTGGVHEEFTLDSPICLTAFYAGVIEGAGGNIEAIPIGQGQVAAGEPQNGIAPFEIAYQTDLYKIKKYGPVIKPASDPISPLQALELQFARGRNDEMLVIHVLYTKLEERELVYGASLNNIQSTATRLLVDKIKPKIISAVRGSGFSVGNVDVTRVIQPPEKKGVIFGFRVYSDDENNAQVGANLESQSPGKFAVQLASSIANTDGTLRSVRYATGFLEKMKSSLN